MIRTELLAAISITSFGLVVGRVVRKEPLESLYQIEDSGGIAIPFTIADLRRSKACKYSCDARLVLGRREPARMSATSSGTSTPTGSPSRHRRRPARPHSSPSLPERERTSPGEMTVRRYPAWAEQIPADEHRGPRGPAPVWAQQPAAASRARDKATWCESTPKPRRS